MTRKSLLLAIVVALLISLAGCNKKPQPPLVFGAGIWPGYEPVYLAREQGYYKGANLRLAEYTSDAEVDQAFRNGTIQVAALTLEKALMLRRDISDVKIILLLDNAGKKRMDVLVTRYDYIGQYPEKIKQLLQGWRRAMVYLRDNPDKAVKVMAQREHITPAQFSSKLKSMGLYDWQYNQHMLMSEPSPVGATINAVQRRMLNEGKLSFGIDPSMLLDGTLLVEPKK